MPAIGYRLVQSGSTSYTYDDDGDLTSATDSSGTTTYAWDSRSRLQSISGPGVQKTTFLYDFGGNLISQVDSGPGFSLTQNLVLDDLTNVAHLSRSNGDSLSVLAGQSIDAHLAVVNASGQVEYGLVDAINSTTATADQNGKLVSSFSYEPFGRTTTTSTYPFQFTGRIPVTTGLYYYRARQYAPCVGRFISEDPVGLGAGKTLLYSYAGDNPVNLVDPSGLQHGGGGVLSCKEECKLRLDVFFTLDCAYAAIVASEGGPLAGVGLGALCKILTNVAATYQCAQQCAPKPPAPPQACGSLSR
jgi:RHS repeat-associated protein